MSASFGPAGLGVVCPRCGCADSQVTHTVRILGKIHRRRVCRHCGRRFVTLELPPVEIPPTPRQRKKV